MRPRSFTQEPVNHGGTAARRSRRSACADPGADPLGTAGELLAERILDGPGGRLLLELGLHLDRLKMPISPRAASCRA